ncbi:uncharacterized protein M421DRAFT_389644 [Didymella exigua CBS 183.55]|uniref:PEBP-like protein n=1 Tax=Didymella exigua CBS 183.55 TaxID=1150837 RepID=A0A6A5RS12_9PLEO|nr:uncharacterized protein M421DRAFT_389644 [Didymella exigua CBS 183.55]KAF1929844.1 hypothetical protein M421DRAFT_389644 [Didymella exigua CBS 183.55]
MTDPDLMMNNNTYFDQVRHWLVTDLSTGPDGALNIDQGQEISPYLGPAPLPNYLYSLPHRYVFIVAGGSGPKTYIAAISGKQDEAQDLKGRWGFNAQKLIEQKGLKAEAANVMGMHGTLASAVTNVGLMGQAAVSKNPQSSEIISLFNSSEINMF